MAKLLRFKVITMLLKSSPNCHISPNLATLTTTTKTTTATTTTTTTTTKELKNRYISCVRMISSSFVNPIISRQFDTITDQRFLDPLDSSATLPGWQTILIRPTYLQFVLDSFTRTNALASRRNRYQKLKPRNLFEMF